MTILDVGSHDTILIYWQASFIRFRDGLILTEWNYKVMRFEVGDLVRNYIGDLLITVDAGFEDAPVWGKACKFTIRNISQRRWSRIYNPRSSCKLETTQGYYKGKKECLMLVI